MVEEGDVRRVRALIDRPALAMARDAKGATPLHNAVLHEQTDTVRYLLQRYPETVNASDRVRTHTSAWHHGFSLSVRRAFQERSERPKLSCQTSPNSILYSNWVS